MKWIKKGLIFKPGKYTWMKTHAQNPFARPIKEGLHRIYFAGRDKNNRAHGGWVDIDYKDNFQLINVSTQPILELGNIGCFDDCGAMPSCIVDHDNKQYMYYTGWSQHVVTPFTFFIGLTISEDNGKTFKRYSLAPVIGRTKNEPFMTCSPWVIKENNKWRMWYVSCTGWSINNADSLPKHFYHICYAESNDGLEWKTDGTVCIDFQKDEYAIARPIVYKENDLYKMWYCFRGGYNTYRAGYAESNDGINWVRRDDMINLDVSEDGWDSEMICYPFVSEYKGQKYMLYNGNNFGQTGIGLALLED